MNPPKPTLKVATTLQEYLDARIVRGIVFWEEQEISASLDSDSEDLSALHIVGYDGREPVAAARISFVDGAAKFERIAVRKRWRGGGLGLKLTAFMIEEAERRGFSKQIMHAQAYLEEFYKKLGFLPVGEKYLEAGIEHLSMERKSQVHRKT